MILSVLELIASAVASASGLKVLRSFDVSTSVPMRTAVVSFLGARDVGSPNESAPIFLEAFYSVVIAAEKIDRAFLSYIENASKAVKSLLTSQGYPVRIASLNIVPQDGYYVATLNLTVRVNL
jgi:hypothetical protein